MATPPDTTIGRCRRQLARLSPLGSSYIVSVGGRRFFPGGNVYFWARRRKGFVMDRTASRPFPPPIVVSFALDIAHEWRSSGRPYVQSRQNDGVGWLLTTPSLVESGYDVATGVPGHARRVQSSVVLL